ncbi:purine-nucleoside phosphorylase [Litorilinea aerophila]|uniref:Purine nucleoside phosphorylase n=1 Tax=Litorilinea aerophila TaxID=1204385 RepID=A0A540VI37_9CHLR|nr:purine-nucleoside phosphorylase [Litorilinea aerophila]MCC9076048.1 purine-nucleoside phosphorylase [Litorilinea aerophila]OUC08555.1 purine nucleoside phosphorylase [Litorilinea aerophila]
METAFTLADYDRAADFIRQRSPHRPRLGLILGSGLSGLAEQVEEADILPYGEIPHFPQSTVAGHAGRLVLGKLAGMSVCVMQGRFHYYEGYSLQQVTLPVRVMARLGVETLIITNAAGGLNPAFAVGDLMLIEDHINFLGMAGHNPLRGPNLEAFGTRFPALNNAYSRSLRELAQAVAAERGLTLRRGVYVAVAGPNFETPAEIRFLRQAGGDAVGMSTVPEVIVAHHAGMRVLAISTITNLAIAEPDSDHAPTHEEVMDAGTIIVPRLTRLLLGILERLAGESP